MTPFHSFGLSDPLVQGILATGYTAPTEIQSRAIPAAIRGQDIIGCAQTGTGKTAAFVLPILNRLGHERAPGKKVIRSLILTPTRELCVQVERCVLDYGRFLPLRTVAIYGGVSIKGQLTALRRGVDIVVATPGRLMDHMERGSLNLGHVEVFVLDEADRMLDMGFINDVRKIITKLPRQRQTMLFSATIPPEVEALAASIQKNPEMIQIGRPRNPIETIAQHWYPVEKQQKMDLLLHMLKSGQMDSVLFSRAPSTAPTRSTSACNGPVSSRWRCTPTAPRASDSARWTASATASTRSWSPPTSPHAGSTSRESRTWSILTCRSMPRTTCIASAGPDAPRPSATPSRFCLRRSIRTSIRLRSSLGGCSIWRPVPTSPISARPGRSRNPRPLARRRARPEAMRASPEGRVPPSDADAESPSAGRCERTRRDRGKTCWPRLGTVTGRPQSAELHV